MTILMPIHTCLRAMGPSRTTKIHGRMKPMRWETRQNRNRNPSLPRHHVARAEPQEELKKSKRPSYQPRHQYILHPVLFLSILPIERPPQPRMLAHRPLQHLPCPDDREDPGRRRLRSNSEQNPPGNLRGVVGTRHILEQEPLWDHVLGRPRRAKVGQDHVALVVCKLTHQCQPQAHERLRQRRRRIQRVVDEVCHIQCKQPVVRAVLDQVEQRHGRVRKLVHIECLVNPLGIVETPVEASQRLRERLAGHGPSRR
mmetsp:Transcript_9847/g.26804  ORF Transcript_9847/g.26804 Transcript_9847/m.26804 type:complete len:256 (-) Transcript_9847:441-1208(-)